MVPYLPESPFLINEDIDTLLYMRVPEEFQVEGWVIRLLKCIETPLHNDVDRVPEDRLRLLSTRVSTRRPQDANANDLLEGVAYRFRGRARSLLAVECRVTLIGLV
jgi:hypothetical protein